MQLNINLHTVYWDNSVLDYLYSIVAILLVWLVLKLIKKWVLSGFKRMAGSSKTTFDDALISAAEKFVVPYLYLLINYIIINQLVLSPKVSHILRLAIIVITIFFAVRVINHAIHFTVHLYMRRHNEVEARIIQLNGILNVIKVVMWGLGFLLLLDNFGYDVTTIVAGLGIGGIAIALAAQNILGDLFSYFVIFFDKPFEIGDFVVVGSESGTIEQIGIKTSRLRTLGGEELIMPNADLVKTPIHNFKRQQRRRVVFNLRVSYSNKPEVLQQIPAIIKDIISSKEQITFDRAHLQNLNETFINFEVVYNISTADYSFYMNMQQAIYLQILEEFKNKHIVLALPTPAVVLKATPQGSVKQNQENNVDVKEVDDRTKLEPGKDII